MSGLATFLEDKVRRYRWEKWWWTLHVPVVVVLYTFFRGLWDAISILYLALVSIYALVITASGAEQAASAAKEATTIAEGNTQ